jgi:L-threonylcarbamoyladenylate synthase
MHDQIVNGLRHGCVITLPTETVYGLSCDPKNEHAVQKLFTLKERDSNKTMLLIASSFDQVMSIADMSAAERDIAQRYWPGALTMILKCRKDVAFSSGIVKNGEIAVRVTSSKIAQEIIDGCGWPLVSTSANKSGGEPAKSVADIRMV